MPGLATVSYKRFDLIYTIRRKSMHSYNGDMFPLLFEYLQSMSLSITNILIKSNLKAESKVI